MAGFHSLSARTLAGEVVKMDKYRGKVVLVENTASLCGTTVRDFTQMNELCEKFSGKLAVLAFPTNQFGHQENSGGQEIVNALKHVRPGNGFTFKGELFDKVEANGENEHPIFKFLKKSLPIPSDDPESLMSNPQFLIWRPVKRTDIAWNFEKFLIGPDGTPIKRYSRNFLTADIAADIAKYV
uniref:Glutathione peroxidase n=1 Tax=Paracalanus parvus TaxID=187406 RepID=A0A0U2TIF1_9MAXI|nr:selenium-dependent glutathione peroxidase [Paracalanus parvus]ALS05147.1 selenium-dependent glutathione peroxidase [Paracalanus parvus]